MEEGSYIFLGERLLADPAAVVALEGLRAVEEPKKELPTVVVTPAGITIAEYVARLLKDK